MTSHSCDPFTVSKLDKLRETVVDADVGTEELSGFPYQRESCVEFALPGCFQDIFLAGLVSGFPEKDAQGHSTSKRV